jgi:hypothetical protein
MKEASACAGFRVLVLVFFTPANSGGPLRIILMDDYQHMTANFRHARKKVYYSRRGI